MDVIPGIGAPDADVNTRHDERQEFWKRKLQAGIESGACKDMLDLLGIEVSDLSAGFTVSLSKDIKTGASATVFTAWLLGFPPQILCVPLNLVMRWQH